MEIERSPVYIHYGCTAFDPQKFQPIRNRKYFTKPFGGLWASDIKAKYGWKEWNKDNDFVRCEEENAFMFRLSENARVYHIYCKEDAENLPLKHAGVTGGLNIDFVEASKLYDAIEYHFSDEKPHDHYHDGLYFALYGWDCDSILILNKDVVVPIEKAGD